MGVLLGDIGATNAKLALLSNGVLGQISWFSVSEFSRFSDVISAFLSLKKLPCRSSNFRFKVSLCFDARLKAGRAIEPNDWPCVKTCN
jgi:glucokinase